MKFAKQGILNDDSETVPIIWKITTTIHRQYIQAVIKFSVPGLSIKIERNFANRCTHTNALT